MTGHVGPWRLWDGEREWAVPALTADQRRLSPRGIVNHAMLIERITSGWRPEDWPPEPSQTPLREEAPSKPPRVVFFLYFSTAHDAEQARASLAGDGFDVTVDVTVKHPQPWLVEAARLLDVDGLDNTDEHMQLVAARHGGEYDGHEIVLRP